jgi:hypothetical protein
MNIKKILNIFIPFIIIFVIFNFVSKKREMLIEDIDLEDYIESVL